MTRWLLVTRQDAIYVVPEDYEHLLDPDGLCHRCTPTVEREEGCKTMVIHHEETLH